MWRIPFIRTRSFLIHRDNLCETWIWRIVKLRWPGDRVDLGRTSKVAQSPWQQSGATCVYARPFTTTVTEETEEGRGGRGEQHRGSSEMDDDYTLRENERQKERGKGRRGWEREGERALDGAREKRRNTGVGRPAARGGAREKTASVYRSTG